MTGKFPFILNFFLSRTVHSRLYYLIIKIYFLLFENTSQFVWQKYQMRACAAGRSLLIYFYDYWRLLAKAMDESISYATTPKNAKVYYSHLCQCMSLKDGVLYGKDHVFEKEHLLSLTPKDICAYFNLKAFGTSHPSDDCTSKLGRSSSLMFYKKAISYFMPHKLMGWNIQSMTGNPTKSIDVNNLVGKVQKLEVRK